MRLDEKRADFARRRRTWLQLLTAGWLIAATSGCASGAPAESEDVAADSNEGTIAGSYLAARHAERTRDLSAAARYLLAALDDDPDNFELLIRAHALLIMDGRFADAVDMAERILRLSPGNPPAQLTLAVEDVRRGRSAAAQARLEGLPLSGVNRIVLPMMNGWIAAAEGRPAAALNALRAMAEVEGFRALRAYHAGMINEVSGRLDAAEDQYREMLTLNGGQPPLRLVAAAGSFFERTSRASEAEALYAKYQFRRAEADLVVTRVTDAASGLAEGFYIVAGALRQDSSLAQSLTYARLALALNPMMPETLLLVGEILDGQGQREQALKAYAEVPRTSPAGWLARLRAAETLHALGRSEEALDDLARMAGERTSHVDPLLIMGQILRIKERFPEAVEAYDEAIRRLKVIERRHWSLFYARGIALERSKQWPRAEADFKRALELEPDQPDVLNYLAYSWVDQGINYEAARRMLDRAVALRPNSGHIVDSLGWVLYRTGQYAEAVPVLERAVELQPQDPVMLDHLGDAYWRVGRQLEATFQWRRALVNNPDRELKDSLERKLRDGLPTATSQNSK